MTELKQNTQYGFAIVCDSGCDFADKFYGKHDVNLVPFHVRLGSEDYLDIIETVPEDFYVKYESTRKKVITSQPSPAEFLEVYEKLIAEGYTKIISIHASSEVSGSYESALSAIADIPEDVLIEVIDTKTISAAEGFIVADTIAMRDADIDFDTVVAHAKNLSSAVRLYFVPMQKNALNSKKACERGVFARMHKVMDSAFGVRFLEHLDEEGKIATVATSPNILNSAGRIARIMSGDAQVAGTLRYVEINAGAPNALSLLEKPLDTNEFESQQAGIASAGPALTCHIGIGSVGIAYIPEDMLFDKDFAGHNSWNIEDSLL